MTQRSQNKTKAFDSVNIMVNPIILDLFYKPIIATVLEWLSPKDLIKFNASLVDKHFSSNWLRLSSEIYYPRCCKQVTFDFGNLKLKKSACLIDQWLMKNKIIISHCTIINFKYSTLRLGIDALSGFTNLSKLVIVKSLMPHTSKCLVNFVSRCYGNNLKELVFVEVSRLEEFFMAITTSKNKATNKLTSLSFYQCHHSLMGEDLAIFLMSCNSLKTLKLVVGGSCCPASSKTIKDMFTSIMLQVIAHHIHLVDIGLSSFILEKCNMADVREALIPRNGGLVEEMDYEGIYKY